MVAVSEALAELDPRVQPLLVGVVHASLDGQQDAVEMPSHCLRKDPELLGPSLSAQSAQRSRWSLATSIDGESYSCLSDSFMAYDLAMTSLSRVI